MSGWPAGLRAGKLHVVGAGRLAGRALERGGHVVSAPVREDRTRRSGSCGLRPAVGPVPSLMRRTQLPSRAAASGFLHLDGGKGHDRGPSTVIVSCASAPPSWAEARSITVASVAMLSEVPARHAARRGRAGRAGAPSARLRRSRPVARSLPASPSRPSRRPGRGRGLRRRRSPPSRALPAGAGADRASPALASALLGALVGLLGEARARAWRSSAPSPRPRRGRPAERRADRAGEQHDAMRCLRRL